MFDQQASADKPIRRLIGGHLGAIGRLLGRVEGVSGAISWAFSGASGYSGFVFHYFAKHIWFVYVNC